MMTIALIEDGFLTDRTECVKIGLSVSLSLNQVNVSVGGECWEDEEYKKKEIMVPVTTF